MNTSFSLRKIYGFTLLLTIGKKVLFYSEYLENKVIHAIVTHFIFHPSYLSYIKCEIKNKIKRNPVHTYLFTWGCGIMHMKAHLIWPFYFLIHQFEHMFWMLIQRVLLSTHNICFGWEIRKLLFFWYTLLLKACYFHWKRVFLIQQTYNTIDIKLFKVFSEINMFKLNMRSQGWGHNLNKLKRSLLGDGYKPNIKTLCLAVSGKKFLGLTYTHRTETNCLTRF